MLDCERWSAFWGRFRWKTALRNEAAYSQVTEMQLEKIYGKSKESREFIATLIAGQRGTPHPQASPGMFFSSLPQASASRALAGAQSEESKTL